MSRSSPKATVRPHAALVSTTPVHTSRGNDLVSERNLKRVGKECLRLINEFRSRQKPRLRPVEWSEELFVIGSQHSRNMSEKKVPFGHAGMEERVRQFPFVSHEHAENLFFSSGRPFPQVPPLAVKSWIDSSGHRENLLGNFDTAAVGVSQESNGSFFVTLLFSRRLR